MSHPPPRSGGKPGKAPGAPVKHTPIPTEWRIELPEGGAMSDADFGGCRSIEAGYARGPVLGQGTYGEVYLAHDLRTKEKVAAKKIKMDNEKEGFPITAIREIKILSALATANEKLPGERGDRGEEMLLRNNVIGLREIVRSGSHRSNNFKGSIYMVFDYMDHDMTGLLERSQREGKRFTVPQIKCYLRQLFCGLALLEMRDVLHRDLKNANLLVNNQGELKIADFGLARYFLNANSGGGGSGGGPDRNMTNRVITLWYRPPELFMGCERYATEIDMWSAGCIMFELLTGKPLFPGKDEADQIDKILQIVGQPTEASMPGCTSYPNYGVIAVQRYPARSRLRQHCESRGIKDPEALDLLEKLLALNPKARVPATKAVVHQYFFSQPMACRPKDMPQFQSSHEMTMKRARQEQRFGGGQQPRQQQGQQGPQGQGGPVAQRQRTQGQYNGPAQGQYVQPQQQGQQGQGYRGGGAGQGQQPYRGGGGGGAPAAGAMGGMGGMRMPGGGAAGGPLGPGAVLPGPILTQAEVRQMGAVPLMPGAVPGMMAPPGMMAGGQQQQGGGYGAGAAGGQPPRFGPASGAGGVHGAQPHRYGGGAQPSWNKERR